MIFLHRPEQDHQFSDRIEERLEEMVVAHQVRRYSEGSGKKLPFLQENETKITSESQINEFLRELEQELREQRMVTSDSCYIDPRTGEIC